MKGKLETGDWPILIIGIVFGLIVMGIIKVPATTPDIPTIEFTMEYKDEMHGTNTNPISTEDLERSAWGALSDLCEANSGNKYPSMSNSQCLIRRLQHLSTNPDKWRVFCVCRYNCVAGNKCFGVSV